LTTETYDSQRYRTLHLMSLRLDWGNWFYQLARSFIVGGASAFSGGIAASSLAPDKFAFGSRESWLLILTIFVINGLMHLMAFLAQSPLPPIEKTATNTISTTMDSKGRLSTVVTKEQKEITTLPPPEKEK